MRNVNSRNHYLIFLDETHERRPLDLDRLAMSIVKSDYEMEKIAFPQITRRLFLEVRPAHANPVQSDRTHFISSIINVFLALEDKYSN